MVVTTKELNIYAKINKVKNILQNANSLKKTGVNSFCGFNYFKLEDFLPALISTCENCNLLTYTSCVGTDKMVLYAINIDNPEEVVTVETPLKEFSLKGCNDMQALGGVQTFARRYLYMMLFDIIEDDMFDKAAGSQKNIQMITKNQITEIQTSVSFNNLNKILSSYKVQYITELTTAQAAEIIKTIKSTSNAKQTTSDNSRCLVTQKQIDLLKQLKVDFNKICEYYNLTDISELTTAQAADILAKKLASKKAERNEKKQEADA